MHTVYGKGFVRLNWLTLVFIFAVTVAGSFVRITGSGMGCPDWPKCFGKIIPPTDVREIPANYKEIYSEKRVEKTERFAKLLAKIGFKSEANKIINDESLLVEQDFNATKTWTEYINRLMGVLAGFGVLFVFVGVWWKYRQTKLLILANLNLVLLVFQAWFGSIVVATNLVPWTITIHMFIAIAIILIQLGIILKISPSQRVKLPVSNTMYWIIGISFFITLFQMFLGTQVREHVDELTRQGFGRESWTELLGINFYIHRTFSWLVLAMMVVLAYLNEKKWKYKIVRTGFIILAIELLSGVLLAYADMPGLVQTAHLVFAAILLAVLFNTMMRMQRIKTN
jgi:cytochrome c oxidase assembly protein subunit 15